MTVYVIQDQQSLNRNTGKLEPRFDVTPAKEYGELRYLLSPSARPFNPDHVLEELRVGLKDFTEDDHVLLIGNPNFMLWIGMLLGPEIDTVKTLQWNATEKRYLEIVAQVYDCEDGA